MSNPTYLPTETCPDCYGYGGRWCECEESKYKKWYVCERCHGTGELHTGGQGRLRK